MNKKRTLTQTLMQHIVFVSVFLVVLTGCNTVSMGTGSSAISGSAAGGTSVGANSSLEHCSAPLGTLAIDDGRNQTWWHGFYSATQVTTVEPLIRLAVQQSNCFVITSIGNQRTDSRLSRITDKQRNSGEYRAGSKQHKGQRVAADYYMEPQIIINNSPVGGIAGSVSGLAGSVGGVLGNVAGSVLGNMDMKSSVVTLSLFDIRSSVQISISEGSSTSTNYGAAMSIFGSKGSGSLSGYQATPAGKATVAAFLDAYNGMVVSLKNYKAQDVEGGLGTGGTLHVN